MSTKKKGGRPPMEPHLKVSDHVKIGFTSTELDTINYQANRAGMTRSEFCKKAALSADISPRLTDEEIEQIRRISGISNNINQIARQTNTFGEKALSKTLREILENLARLLRHFFKADGYPKLLLKSAYYDDRKDNLRPEFSMRH